MSSGTRSMAVGNREIGRKLEEFGKCMEKGGI